VDPFFTVDRAATALVCVTLAAAVLVEWAITLSERVRSEPRLSRRFVLAATTLREVTLLATGERRDEDRSTKWVLQGSVVVGLVLAWEAQAHLTEFAFSVRGWAPTILGVALMWAGIGLRGWAIATLGRFFRRDIQVAAGQTVVRAGPYAAIRHPADTGNLLVYAGVGVILENWASVAAMVVVPLLGHIRRITVEEAMLAERLGEPYREYAATTARLLPGVW